MTDIINISSDTGKLPFEPPVFKKGPQSAPFFLPAQSFVSRVSLGMRVVPQFIGAPHVIYSAVGLTTSLLAVSGGVTAYDASKGVLFSNEVKDKKGLLQHSAKVVSGTALLGAGLTQTSVRAAQIASTLNGFEISTTSTSSFGVFAFFATRIGVGLISFAFALLALFSAFKISELASFKYKFNRVCRTNDQAKITAFIQNRLAPTEEQLEISVNKKINKEYGADREKRLLEEGRALLKAQLPRELKSLGAAPPKDIEGFITKVYGEEGIRNFAILDRKNRLLAKKAEKAQRLFSSEAKEAFKSGNVDVNEIQRTLSKRIAKESLTLLAALLMAAGQLLLLTTPVGWAVLAGGSFILIAATILATFAILAINEQFKAEKIGPWDKPLVILSTGMAFVVLAMIIWLGTIGYAGILPFAIAGLISGTWFGLNSALLYRICQIEKKMVGKTEKEPTENIKEFWTERVKAFESKNI
jgi:hypothetical protein